MCLFWFKWPSFVLFSAWLFCTVNFDIYDELWHHGNFIHLLPTRTMTLFVICFPAFFNYLYSYPVQWVIIYVQEEREREDEREIWFWKYDEYMIISFIAPLTVSSPIFILFVRLTHHTRRVAFFISILDDIAILKNL